MGRSPTDFEVRRFHVDLSTGAVRFERAPCADVEDVLGGIGRATRLLAERPVEDAYDPRATLVMNLGVLSGTQYMTGLRTFFHGYSPLKASLSGRPGVMWSAGSGKFGTKLRGLGVDEVLFTGRCAGPTVLHLRADPDADGGVAFDLGDAADLAGGLVNEKIQTLHGAHPDAHFAVIGPAGEAWESCRYAAIALSTENQLRSGEPKPRFCGRGGFGGVMGSKNLLAIVADGPDPAPPRSAELVALNKEVAGGKGSQRMRESSDGSGGGTWRNMAVLHAVHALPEMNFVPTGGPDAASLSRGSVEAGPYVVKAESCHRCGIRCHKNVFDEDEGAGSIPAGETRQGRFRAKLDYEPLCMLSSNLGIFDPGQACDLVLLVDELGMDSISIGATLSYAMEHNRRGGDIAGGLAFGDFEATRRAIEEIGRGRLPELGQGSKRLSEALGATGYAMHCKGVELPAYLPHTNPGYPWALAGGHMSMGTFLLLMYQRETGLDYWVDAITKTGWRAIREDLTGGCKFAGMKDPQIAEAIHAASGLEIDKDGLVGAVRRTFLRGYALERRGGFEEEDYALPADAHGEFPQTELPDFVTEEFFGELRTRVSSRLAEMCAEEGIEL